MLGLLGVTSGILSVICYFPYVRDIFHKTTKPERASWLIWSILGTIAFFSQRAEGATWSLFLTGLDTLGVIFIFILSLKFGSGGLTKRDGIALLFAAVGLLLWYLTQHAVIALLLVMLIDVAGASLTVIKAYDDPGSETMSTWIIMGIACLLGMLAVGKFSVILLAYPFYIFLANTAVVVAMLLGQRKK